MDKSKKNKKKKNNKKKKKPVEMKQSEEKQVEMKQSEEKKSMEANTKIPKEDEGALGDKKKKRIKKKKNVETYKSAIFKVLKNLHPDMNISCNAMEVMNSLIKDMFEKIVQLSSRRARFNHSNTITILDIETVVSVLLPRELAGGAMIEGTKAVINVMTA